MKHVEVTGIAASSALGSSLGTTLEGLRLQNKVLLKSHRFGRYAGFSLGEVDQTDFSKEFNKFETPNRMLLANLSRLAQATQVFDRYPPEKIGFYCGTTTAGTDGSEAGLLAYHDGGRASRHPGLSFREQPGIIDREVRAHFPIRGFGAILTTACSAGALAIAMGRRALVMGGVDAVIVGGFDVLCPITIAGFNSLQILDAEPCRPFLDSRAGISLAEGGAFLLLERPGAFRPMARLVGSGMSTDGFHMTRPDPSGLGMQLAMTEALRDADLVPSQISYINAHATGTELNDATEARAIHSIFGARVPVGATKACHGHALAGTGALEAALSVASLTEQMIWGSNQEAKGKLAEQIHLQETAEKCEVHSVLSNSFGFGGNNVSLVFSRAM